MEKFQKKLAELTMRNRIPTFDFDVNYSFLLLA